MGSVRRASAWLGLVDDSEMRYYDDEYAEESESGDVREAWATDPRVQVTAETAQGQGTRIATVTPDGFRDARGIGELFREGIPVIVNLTAMEPADAKRVVDFAAGADVRAARLHRARGHARLPADPARLPGDQRRGPPRRRGRLLQPELSPRRALTGRRRYR